MLSSVVVYQVSVCVEAEKKTVGARRWFHVDCRLLFLALRLDRCFAFVSNARGIPYIIFFLFSGLIDDDCIDVEYSLQDEREGAIFLVFGV